MAILRAMADTHDGQQYIYAYQVETGDWRVTRSDGTTVATVATEAMAKQVATGLNHTMPATADTDGYSADSLAGYTGDGGEAAMLDTAPDSPTGAVSVQPIVTDITLATPDEPFTILEPLTGETFRFLHPDEVPSMHSMILVELQQAAVEGQTPDLLLTLVLRFMRVFMAPGEMDRFARVTAATHRGADGSREIVRWLNEDVGPRYTGFPTRPAPNS